jgi:hypothetical protein
LVTFCIGYCGTRYLTILEDLLLNPGQAKMGKMEKILVRMENFHVRMEKLPVKMEKIIVFSWQEWICNLEAEPCGLSSGHKERALRCVVSSEM